MDPMLWTWGAAALSGAVVGLFLAVFGGGGSVLAAPLLLYFVGIADPHVAIGTSAAGVAVNAMTGLAGHARAGRVTWPCATLFAATGVLAMVANLPDTLSWSRPTPSSSASPCGWRRSASGRASPPASSALAAASSSSPA